MKSSLRKRILEARDRLSPDEQRTKSVDIENRLFALPEVVSASTILFFASFRSEVQTHSMIRKALAAGKRVALPKVKGKDLAFYEIKDFETDVVPGTWGILEPHEKNPITLDPIDLIIVPGVAFDERCNRLGYGAGFYDRVLSKYKLSTVAIAFEVQLVPDVPMSQQDVPVQKIVTEKRIITTKKNRI